MAGTSNYRLREMKEKDLELTHKWRNTKSIREVSGSNKRFSLDEHRVWFDCSTSAVKYVFEEDGKAQGVIIYDRQTHYWSFYLNPSSRRRSGLGRLMLSLFLLLAKDEGFKEIKAEIKHDNRASITLHYQLGFFLSRQLDNKMIELKKEI